MMHWRLSHRFDPLAVCIADRHYSRQKPGTPQFVPPGRNVVLLGSGALWVSLWQEYVQHGWAGAWVCSLFRNEGPVLSSLLVRQAVSCTRWRWGKPPDLGMVTFVDPEKVRRKRDPGRCFRRAGFEPDGHTQGGLLVLRLPPDRMPEPAPPLGSQGVLLHA